MNRQDVTDQLKTFESFSTWESVYTEARRAEQASPHEFDLNNREHLLGRVAVLDVLSAEHESRNAFMLDVARTDDDLLPLPYRLGILAGFKTAPLAQETRLVPNGNKSFSLKRGGKSRSLFHIDTSEIPVRREEHPLARAMQIAHEVEKVQRSLDSDKPVPVCMVWRHHFTGLRLDTDEVVLGEVRKPREAFVLAEPVVVEQEAGQSIDFVIPTKLRGVTKGEVVWKDEYLQDERKYKNPDITALSKLLSGSLLSPTSLFIGNRAVKERVKRAREDMARNKRIHSLRRRESLARGGRRRIR